MLWLNVPLTLFSLLWCGRYIRMCVPTRRKQWHPSSILLLVSSVGLWMMGLLMTCRDRNTSQYGQMGGTERD
ncbi:hypothetical protein T3H97_04670 [Paenibacillus sp. LX16]|uniref:hypothetical protein n=1 Tax=Paenibacillus sp. LX16 TaxID=1740264 RepID=UPI002E2A2306|nr:hypothetical protein [Paenibacillus sp. LX16]